MHMLIDDLFKDEDVPVESPESSTETEPSANEPQVLTTKAVSERINEVKRKTQTETRDSVAKELGYESYTKMVEARSKEQESKILKEAGLDETDVSKTITELVNKRLAEDPRMKKLEEYEARQKTDFVSKQLSEINDLTGNTYTDITQLPKETLKLWEVTGNLKQAYLATQGESMIHKIKETSNKGTMNHLAEAGSKSNPKVRFLSEEEKKMYKFVNPRISDEELNKKTIEVKD